MLPKPQEKQQAITLRKQGLSYSEILQHVPVAHATLSLWLRDISLSEEQKHRLRDISQGAGARARKNQRLGLQVKLENEVQREFSKLIKDPFFTAGLMLYWAEGSKAKPWQITAKTSLINSDEQVILTIRKWFLKYCKISKEKFVYWLHIHETADAQKAREVWASILNINEKEIRITLKRNKVVGRHKHDDYKGLISISVRKSTWLNRRIELWTKYATESFLQS